MYGRLSSQPASFIPRSGNGGLRILYSDWMLKFCVSVSWRTLLLMRENGWLMRFSERQRTAVDHALEHWAKFMLGKLPHPGPYEQHVIMVGSIDSSTLGGLPANINRYLLRTVDLDVVRTSNTAFVLTKMGKFFLLGFIDVLHPRQWRGTKINANRGHIGQTDNIVPSQFWDYLKDEARRYAATHNRISERQRRKIDETMWGDLDRVAQSPPWRLCGTT